MKDALPNSSLERRGRPWLSWAGSAALAVGLAVGALALAAPLGIWLGAWEFGTGFTVLAAAHAAAWPIAIATLLVTLAVFAIGRATHAPATRRATAFAAVGTLVAGLAYYVPESYRPPSDANVPPIHDISTDTADPPAFDAVLPLRADAPNTAEYGRSEGMTPARLAELTSEAYPDLRSQRLDVPPDTAFDRALAAVDELGWELVDTDRAGGRIEATDTTFWFRFKDDIVIRIRPDGDGALVDARSVSRVGTGDVGTNARRLREFFAAL